VLSYPYALRFLFATRPAVMGRVPGIVYRTLATHQIRKAGHTHRSARTGAVTLIQRFGSALNLNIHFHMLLLDGAYAGSEIATAMQNRFPLKRFGQPEDIANPSQLPRI